MGSDYSDDQIHRILLEGYFFFTVKALCEKWGITPSRLRTWKKIKFNKNKPLWALEDAIIAAIYRGGWHAPADLIGWLDYRNHALYSEDEVRAMFETLEARGEVKRSVDGAMWMYVQLEPPYVFGPRQVTR